MSERLLALASGVHDGNPPEVSPPGMVRIAADAGYNSVGLWVAPGDNWHSSTAGEVAAALQETGLVALDVEVIWLQPGGKPDPLHHEIIAMGGEVGAKNCLIVSSEPDREVTKHLYEDLCIHAERAGMRACLEYMAITEVKTLDDALDVVGIHGLGGTWGALATGIFALEEFAQPGQLLIQLEGVIVTIVFAGVGSWILLKVTDLIVGLRVDEEAEYNGLDLSEHSERGYVLGSTGE